MLNQYISARALLEIGTVALLTQSCRLITYWPAVEPGLRLILASTYVGIIMHRAFSGKDRFNFGRD